MFGGGRATQEQVPPLVRLVAILASAWARDTVLGEQRKRLFRPSFVQVSFSLWRAQCVILFIDWDGTKMRLNRASSFLAMCLLLLGASVIPVMAQQQEKRIALVIGNGAYAKRPLATAANDGGLIAQTLQAAGFDAPVPATSTATLCAIRFGISSRRRKNLARHRRRRLSPGMRCSSPEKTTSFP